MENHGKSLFLMGKSTISMAISNSKLLIYQVPSLGTKGTNFNQNWFGMFVGLGFEVHSFGTFPARCKQCDQVLQGDCGRIINSHSASDDRGSTGYGLWG